MTPEQIADTLAAALGRRVQVRALAPEAIHAALLAQGAPQWFADAQRELATAMHDGRAEFTAAVTDTVANLKEAPPRTLERFAHAHFDG